MKPIEMIAARIEYLRNEMEFASETYWKMKEELDEYEKFKADYEKRVV